MFGQQRSGAGSARAVGSFPQIALTDEEGNALAVMDVEETYEYDKHEEARLVYRTEDEAHPGVAAMYAQDEILLGGPVTVFNRQKHSEFLQHRRDPKETRAVFVESPGSLTFEIQDVPAIAAAAHAKDIVVIADNTWATPFFFDALGHGADIVVMAATKYIVGHSDAMLGTVTANDKHYKQLRETHGNLGLCVGPDDIYLGQRGLRTLAVRLKQHQKTAQQLAEWLRARPEVERVLYPALPDDPGHKIWKRDFKGASGLFGVELKPCSKAAVAAMLDHMELFGMGWSWGGYESLIVPAHPGRTVKKFEHRGPLIRISAGLEAAEDLIADLDAGLERLKKAG